MLELGFATYFWIGVVCFMVTAPMYSDKVIDYVAKHTRHRRIKNIKDKEIEYLRRRLNQLMLKRINSVIHGKVHSVKLLCVRPFEVTDYIKSIGGEEYIDTDEAIHNSNIHYVINGKKYTLKEDEYYMKTSTFETNIKYKNNE